MNDREGKMLSVVVPIYGVEEYLETCIDSIVAQTYRHLEIILVDDGAKGREPKICDKYAKQDSRIKVIHKSNAGLLAARKTGLDNVTAEYVTFVDGDDYIASDYYELMMRHVADNDDVDLVAVSFTQVTDDKCELPAIQSIESGVYEGSTLLWLHKNMNCKNCEFYTFGIWHSNWSKIYKTDLLRNTIKGSPNSIRMGEDAAISFPYILKCNKIIVDNSITGYYYRIVPESMSRTCDGDLFLGLNTLYNYLKPIYAETNDTAILEQLEYLRASLIDNGISLWMASPKYTEVSDKLNRLRFFTEQIDLFKDIDKLLNLNIPRRLCAIIQILSCNDWDSFERLWKRRILLSYLNPKVMSILRYIKRMIE